MAIRPANHCTKEEVIFDLSCTVFIWPYYLFIVLFSIHASRCTIAGRNSTNHTKELQKVTITSTSLPLATSSIIVYKGQGCPTANRTLVYNEQDDLKILP